MPSRPDQTSSGYPNFIHAANYLEKARYDSTIRYWETLAQASRRAAEVTSNQSSHVNASETIRRTTNLEPAIVGDVRSVDFRIFVAQFIGATQRLFTGDTASYPPDYDRNVINDLQDIFTTQPSTVKLQLNFPHHGLVTLKFPEETRRFLRPAVSMIGAGINLHTKNFGINLQDLTREHGLPSAYIWMMFQQLDVDEILRNIYTYQLDTIDSKVKSTHTPPGQDDRDLMLRVRHHIQRSSRFTAQAVLHDIGAPVRNVAPSYDVAQFEAALMLLYVNDLIDTDSYSGLSRLQKTDAYEVRPVLYFEEAPHPPNLQFYRCVNPHVVEAKYEFKRRVPKE